MSNGVDVSKARYMNKYEIKELVDLLSDSHSSYTLARMYVEKSIELDDIVAKSGDL